MSDYPNLPANRVEAIARQLSEAIENDGAGTARVNNLLSALIAATEQRDREHGR